MELELLKSDALFNQAEKHERQGKFGEAFDCLLCAAEMGNLGAQTVLGDFYSSGKGVKKDLKKAAYWYQKSYKDGNPSGAFNLAIDRQNQGRIRSAVLWFNRALAMHYGEAAIHLAKIYMVRPNGKRRPSNF